MSWPEIFLLCFASGGLWAIASLLLGGLRFIHFGHFGHINHAGSAKLHTGHRGTSAHLVNPSCIAVFLAWFGGAGYLLLRHSALPFWMDLCVAIILGLAGASILARFLALLNANERVMNPADYELAGTLGRVACAIRPDGVGEVFYVRDGACRAVPARSEDGVSIPKDAEVVVLRHEKGIAYVRSWDAVIQQAAASN